MVEARDLADHLGDQADGIGSELDDLVDDVEARLGWTPVAEVYREEPKRWRFNICLRRYGGFVVTVEPWTWRTIRKRFAGFDA